MNGHTVCNCCSCCMSSCVWACPACGVLSAESDLAGAEGVAEGREDGGREDGREGGREAGARLIEGRGAREGRAEVGTGGAPVEVGLGAKSVCVEMDYMQRR
jgi:hypothetical protein